MKMERMIGTVGLVVALALALVGLRAPSPSDDRGVIIIATPAAGQVSPAFAAELPPAANIRPAIEPTPALPTAELPPPEVAAEPQPPIALAEPPAAAPAIEAPAVVPAIEAPAAAPAAEPSFYPDVGIERDAAAAYRDLPVLECPCGPDLDQPYATMTARQEQQSRQRTR